MENNMKKKQKKDEGFTLVEMMAALVILTLIMGIAVVATAPMRNQGNTARIKGDFNSIRLALSNYELDMGSLPPEELGLEALVKAPTGLDDAERYNGPYLEKLPLDPWKRPYIYINPGDDGRDFDIITYGADKQPGGEDKDKDVSFWDENL